MGDTFKTVENGNIINADKTGINKEAVQPSLDSSVKDTLIKTHDYAGERTEQPQGSPERDYPRNNASQAQASSETPVQGQHGTQPQHKNYRQYATDQPQTTGTTERYGQQEQPQSTGHEKAKYGSAEKAVYGNEVIGGAAGAATVAGASGAIIHADKSGNGSTFVKETFADTVKANIVKPTQADVFADKVWSVKEANEKKGLIKTVGGVAGREIEAAVGVGGGDHDLTDRAKGQAAKYGYKAGKYAILGGSSVIRGTYRISRYTSKLTRDVKAGTISGKEARLAALERAKVSVSGGKGSVGKIIKGGVVKGIEDFHGSDDLGMQAITKPKDVVVKTRRTFKTVHATGKAVKTGVKGTAKVVQKAAIKVQQAAKYMATVTKKAFANPVFIKAAGIVAGVIVIIALIMAIVSAVSSIIPTITLKSSDEELTKTYKYVTELDARLTEEIRSYPDRWENNNIDQFHYYVNGYEADPENITITTPADMILLYFDCKYNDYAFDKVIYGLFGGTNVKSEIEAIHDLLYQVSTNKWKEEIEHTDTYTDIDGVEHTDTWTETIWHLDINVTMQSFSSYLSENIDTLLTKDEQSKMEAMQTAGMYTTKKELGNPFKDTASSWGISDRFGWRIHPITGVLSDHTGIDIPMDGGTPINNVLYGTVSTVAYDSGGYGNYVVVTWGNKEVLYGHMSSVAVSQGQTVNKGDIVGYVGSTGSSTGNHLHIEYKKDGYTLNPQFYLEGATAGAALGGGAYASLIAYAEQYLGLPYVFGGSAPPTFDCSGFVCWVYTHSGTYNLPRTGAQGIYNQCTQISESEAQPGDLVFFYNTYDSPNPITHVGIYVGNGQMLHCGSPIQYTSFHTSYWQSHNPVFGRLN